MSDEITKSVLRTLRTICIKEKGKAIEKEDYVGAIIASVFKGMLKEAEN